MSEVLNSAVAVLAERPSPERALVLAPHGRDGKLAARLLQEAGMAAETCADLPSLVQQIERGASCAIVIGETIVNADLHSLSAWINAQPSWSDLPFIVVTERGGGLERNPSALRLMEALGNVTFVERPFHPSTLVSLARTALRSRRRQYLARTQQEEQNQREAALQDSEERFRTLADNIPVLAWTAHADGWIFWYNPRWYEYTGTTPERMLGWGWREVHDPAILPAVQAKWEATIASGTMFEMVFPLRGADGVMRPFLTRIVPVRDEQGRVLRWFGTNVDISAERAAEAVARASEERLRFALASANLGAWELDRDTTTLQCSDSCKANFGRSAGVAFSYDDLIAAIYPDDLDIMQARVRESFERQIDYIAEYRVFWPDQTVHWVEVRGRTLRGPDNALRMTGVSRDITAAKAAEAELRQHRERLEELVTARTSELAAALEQLHAEVVERERTEEALRQSQKMEAIGQLTGGIAHDFNNLLTGIAGSMELMQTRLSQGRTSELGRYIAAAAASVDRAAALTHRLLAFARRQTLELKLVDVNQLAAGMEDLVRRTAGPSIQVEMVFAGALWDTTCDANQLEGAILNLCINAKDAMPEGGRLTIETANTHLDDAYAQIDPDLQPGQYVALSVTDNGSGMTPETAARAFDPFFTTKPIGQGTGLGLSMVYGFVKQSEGHVRIYSEPGVGTTVRMYLPRRYARDPTTAATPIVEVDQVLPAKAGTTVLVVEDEATVRALIVEALQELGYNTVEAIDGPSALRVLEDTPHLELLLTDVGLPGMNGRQLADAARRSHPDLKVLFITGYAHNAAVGNHLLDAGMHMVAKPFALNTLAAKVQALIEA